MTDDERGRAYYANRYPNSVKRWSELAPQMRARFKAQARRINFTPPEGDGFGQPHRGHDERDSK